MDINDFIQNERNDKKWMPFHDLLLVQKIFQSKNISQDLVLGDKCYVCKALVDKIYLILPEIFLLDDLINDRISLIYHWEKILRSSKFINRKATLAIF